MVLNSDEVHSRLSCCCLIKSALNGKLVKTNSFKLEYLLLVNDVNTKRLKQNSSNDWKKTSHVISC